MARTVVSNKLFTASVIAIQSGMAHASKVRDRNDPDYQRHMADFASDRWTQIFRSCNDGNPNSPKYMG